MYEQQKKGFWHSIPAFIRILICAAIAVPVLVFLGAMLYILPPVVTGGLLAIATLVIWAIKEK